MQNDELKSFIDYINKEEEKCQKIIAELNRRELERENSHMNTYGVATFKELSAMKTHQAISTIKKLIPTITTMQQLGEAIFLAKETATNEEKANLETSLKFFEGYLDEQNNKVL